MELVLESTTNASDDNSEAAPETMADTRTTLTTVESGVGRTTDPVGLYMREMGTVDLLTRELRLPLLKNRRRSKRTPSCMLFLSGHS